MAILPQTVSSPKLEGRSVGYRYYAGFSPAFVRDVLMLWPRDARVLDPWNGSGTTTRVAAELGLECVGADLNPAMVVAARGQLITASQLRAARGRIEGLARSRAKRVPVDADDPLLQWVRPQTAGKIRALIETLVGSTRFSTDDVEGLSAEQALWITGLFTGVKRRLAGWKTSNPTWTKVPHGDSPSSIHWRHLVNDLISHVSSAVPAQYPERVRVRLGSSTALGEHQDGADLIVGSPPYLTRIDYAVATRLELSVLGLSAAEQAALRSRLLGTTTVPPTHDIALPHLGVTASAVAEAVRTHPSKASSTYYWKWLVQYLAGYAASLEQVAAVPSRDGMICLVVQDSYYKDVHLDLPEITVESLEMRGWKLAKSYDFPPKRSMAQINPRAVAYQTGSAQVTEKALFFTRE